MMISLYQAALQLCYACTILTASDQAQGEAQSGIQGWRQAHSVTCCIQVIQHIQV